MRQGGHLSGETPMSRIVLTHCTLWDGTSPEVREDMHVLVEGERIREISERSITAPQAQVIDCQGKTLMPGLIDAHVHLIATSLNLGQLAQEPVSLTMARARHIAEGMLQRGFTTVRDAGGADWGLAAAIEYGLIDGPRVFYAGRALSQTGGHGDFRSRTLEADQCACCMAGTQFSVIADGVPEVQKAARQELRRGATQIKIMASGGVASPTDPVWNLQYSEDEIRAVVWEARSWRTYVMAHAYTPEAIARCVRLGVRSIEHGNLIDQETAALDIIGDSVYWLYAHLCDLTRQTARVPGGDRPDARRVCACAAGFRCGLCHTLSARQDLGRQGAPTPGRRRRPRCLGADGRQAALYSGLSEDESTANDARLTIRAEPTPNPLLDSSLAPRLAARLRRSRHGPRTRCAPGRHSPPHPGGRPPYGH